MKRFYLLMAFIMLTISIKAQTTALSSNSTNDYIPSAENLKAREAFANDKLGIFIHWGLYSMFAQGEWYMQNRAIPHEEYSKAARAFYPIHFNADDWVDAIKDSGAGYICLTSRHHEGFSLWDTKESDYNIMNTPFKRDIIKELADACHKQNVRLHLYYSHLDWGREDYPMGRTGHGCKDSTKADWPHYYKFMNNQLTELLTNYGSIGAIWFDGWWDHDQDSIPFDWQLPQQYALIHRLQPACLIGNNHHMEINPGEDIQIFERDLPGENTAGFVDRAANVSTSAPLETCQTMNGMWGYRIVDQNYKSVKELIHLLVKTSGKGANLLLNIGPQPSGELPATALDRLKGMGAWMREFGETIKGTTAGDIKEQNWGATTRKGNTLYVHILNRNSIEGNTLPLPLRQKAKSVKEYKGAKLKFKNTKDGVQITLGTKRDDIIDYIIEIEQ